MTEVETTVEKRAAVPGGAARALVREDLGPPLRVLIADFDLFSEVGGGQTFYRSLVENHPKTRFFYLSRKDVDRSKLPSNVTPIPYRIFYHAGSFGVLTHTGKVVHTAVEAMNIAASVAGRAFDVVDFPDYQIYGTFLRPAFEFHKVQAGRFALSMHGVMSTTIERNWEGDQYPKAEIAALQALEKLQYQASDIRYGISTRYIEEWNAIAGLKAHEYDPLRVVRLERPSANPPISATVRPRYVFIGRTEKRKGPDLAIDLVSALPDDLRGPLYVIGPDSPSHTGVSSWHFLRSYAALRNVELIFTGTKSPAELKEFLSEPCVVLLPSRYDTFNLLALETLFMGCPTFVGNGAGVVDYLRDVYPELDHHQVDTSNSFTSADAFAKTVRQFAARRADLIRKISSFGRRDRGDSLSQIYLDSRRGAPEAREMVESQFQDVLRILDLRAPKSRPSLKRMAIQKVKNQVRRNPVLGILGGFFMFLRKRGYRTRLKNYLIRWVSAKGQYDRALEFYYFIKGFMIRKCLKALPRLRPSAVPEDGKRKPSFYELAVGHRFGRVRIFLAAAYAEERAGNPALAATYGLRVMRLVQDFSPRLISDVKRWLVAGGFVEEARAVDLMYPEAKPAEIAAYLEDRRVRLCELEKPVFEVFEEHREKAPNPKISIIVSMYNAASKLPRFLDLLKNQKLIETGAVELILVESGSPGNQLELVRNAVRNFPYPYLLVRTPNRETIQSAWNRGLAVSNAPYVCFLGVDETLRAGALEILLDSLEKNPDVDWVMGDSVVTEVSMNAEWLRDVMVYDRRGFDGKLHILECCYFSYVGGLYRKNIHERVGYYDATFRAAGDTEFKNRALPFIKLKHIPETLGIFLNYPEERTTQHPRAELEDLRAWYLFRSEGGLRYLTQRMDDAEKVELLNYCLSYRKSYCGHLSHDLDLFDEVLKVIPEAARSSEIKAVAADVARSKSLLERLEWNVRGRLAHFWSFVLAERSLRTLRGTADSAVGGKLGHRFAIFHNNRHEQHSNIW